MNIIVKLPDGTETTHSSVSGFENRNGELYITIADEAPITYGSGEWVSYKEVKNETV